MPNLARMFRYYLPKAVWHAPFPIRKALFNLLLSPYTQGHAADGTAPLFSNIYLELRTRCNSRVCTFCPASHGNETRPDVTMPFPLYEKIIGELSSMDYKGRIAYYLSNEPFMVHDLPKYLAHARQHLPKAWLQLTTNGLALTEKSGRAALEAGLNMMILNIYNDDLTAPLPPNIQRFESEALHKLYPMERILTGNRPLPPQDQGVFVYNVHRRRATQILHNRGGSAPNKTAHQGRSAYGMCDNPFHSLTVTADGRVGRCCNDHYIHMPMGNCQENTLQEIWNGERFRGLRQSLLAHRRPEDGLCDVCDVIGIRWGHHRGIREYLLKLLENQR